MDWDKIDAVQRMQDYIVSHLDGEMRLWKRWADCRLQLLLLHSDF